MGNNELIDNSKRKSFPACCDIYNDNGLITINMEMPGVSKENLDVKVDGDHLLIHGKKNSFDISNGEYLIHETKDGDYYQEFLIDDTIDRTKINAAMKNGILSLTLGLKESEKPKKIKITAN